MAIAAGYWGAPAPACKQSDGELIRPHAVLANSPAPAPDVAAWAEVGGCRIWLDTDFWPSLPSEEYCNLIAHEWGHLLGHGHSGNAHELMWPQRTNEVVPGCAEFRSLPAPPGVSHGRAEKTKTNRARAVRRRQAAKLRRARRSCAARWRHSRRLRGRWARRRASHLRKRCERLSKPAASSSRFGRDQTLVVSR